MHSIPALLVNQPCDLELKGVGIQIRYLAMGVTKLQVGGLSSAKANQQRGIYMYYDLISYMYIWQYVGLCVYIYIFMIIYVVYIFWGDPIATH